MLIDWGFPTVFGILKGAVKLIRRPVKYVMSSESFADDLRKEVRNLENEAGRVGDLAQVARNNLRSFYDSFTEWQQSADKALEEARNLSDAFDKASKTCCYGTLPDPYCRYQFSTKAEAKIKVLRELAQNCIRFRTVDDICSIDPAPRNVAAPIAARREGKDVIGSSMSIKLRDADVFESRALMIRSIMDALDDNSNSVVGVYGMGGVGKSTLLNEVKKMLSEEKSFDWVAKANVSENPDIKTIQGEIANGLRLTAIGKENEISGRAELLHERLEKEKKVLIILDNLWKGLDLKSVGIPLGPDNKVKGCKLLLTSRNRDVLRREMGCDKAFHLSGLEEEEAKRLFERMVGDKVHDDEFKPWVKVALSKCAGVPFLIDAMAKRFKDAELYEWRDTLKNFEEFKDKQINDLINHVLKWSYDKLEEDVKSLLRLCVVYGISKPSLENLVRYGFGLGLFREVSSMEEARDRLRSQIRTLQASSLLLDSEDVDVFKIHDLVREFVASVTSRDHPFLVLKDKDKLITELSKDKFRSCEAICFPYIDMEELPQELDCPELQILLLFNNNVSLEVPNSYFNSMRKLAVLNLTSIHLTHSLMPFQFLENLHALCLQFCSLEEVAILGKLKGLQILSIVGSKIRQLPKEIGQLVELRLLDLSHCSQLEIIEPGVLRNLIKLEELYMENSFYQWNALEQTPPTNASLIELNNMKNLYTLHVHIPNPSVLPKDLNLKQLNKYKILIGCAWCWRQCKGSRTLQLNLNPTNDFLQKECIKSILSTTDDLVLEELSGIEQSICRLFLEGFPQLKYLRVENSPSVHYILEWSSLPTFKKLETLLLKNLNNLEKICHNHISTKSFRTLKVIRVEHCEKMEVLFPPSLVRELPHLEEIKVDSCRLMQGIAEADDCGKFELPNFHVLKLRNLPNMKNFFTSRSASLSSTSNHQVGTQVAFFNGQQISIPSLHSLTMEGLPNMKEIWSDESPLELSNLRSLEVVRCKSLLKVISSKSLVHKLHCSCISDCNSVQEILNLDGPNDSGDVKTFPQLTTLVLKELESLRCIWDKDPCGIVGFHNLNELEVYKCDNLEFMFFLSTIKSLTKLRHLTVKFCNKMEAIIMEEEGFGMGALETLAFPMLTSLNLIYLKSLKCFSLHKCSREARSQDSVKSHATILFNLEIAFQRLETLEINGLDNLEFIFFPSMVKSLTQLKKLIVSYCKKTEVIIMDEEVMGMETLEILAFPMLTHLCLTDLRSLTCFSHGKCAQESRSQDHIRSRATALFNQEISMPYLESLTMERLPNIKEIWSDESPFELSNLRSLKVDQCELLSKVIGSRSSVKLHALCSLCIRHCSSMQEIFDLDGPNANGNVKTLNELTTLELIKLESLRCIWNKNPCGILSLPNLKELKAWNCPNLRFMFFPSMVRSLIQLRDLRLEYCNKMEAIIREEEGLGLEISETLAFPKLTNLSLNHLASLRCFSCGKCSREARTQDCDQTHSAALFSREVSFPSLETLYISDMDNIEMIWDSLFEVVFELQPLNPTNGHPVALPLKKLTVSKLPKLKRVWDKKLHHQVKFQCLRSVSIFECKSLASLFPASVARDLIQLEKLEINNCGIVEFIEKEGELVFGFDFPKLTSLQLKHLTELKCIYTGAHALQWPALKTLEVHGCNKVEILASQLENETPCHKQPLFLVGKGAFPSLQELKLDLSEWMEMWHGHFHDEEFFCKLRVLELRHLSKEYAISTCRFVESLTNLEELVVCESYLEEPTSNVEAIERPSQELKVILPFSRYVRLLKTLNVSRCDGLSSMFTPKIARNLVALTKLRISNCRMLTEVINDEGSKEAHVVAFNHLKCMELDGLVSLKCFSSGGYILMFPLLEDVIVNGCPKMKFFSEGPIEAPKLERVQVSREAWFWKENLNITIQNMFEEMDTIVGATFVRLSEFPELVGKWHSKLNPVKSSWHLKSLVIDKCPSFVNAIPSKLMPVLDGMRQLQVHNCELLEEIFDLEGLEAMESTQVLPSFLFLSLVNLPKLRQLWNKDLQGSLPCNFLTQIALYKCSNLRHVFIPSMASCLANLQWMKIEECGKMEGVIAEEESQVSAVKNITFPNLATMVLECLPNLTSFLLGKNHMLECPDLRRLTIAHCPKMRSLAEQSFMDMNHGAPSLFTPQVQFPHLMLMDFSHMDNVSKIWTDIPQENLTFDYLEEVDVRNCKSLENMFPHWVATSLTQLDTLRVESCGIEEIVTSEDDSPHSNVAQILFPKLISLVLHDMPRLQSFSLNLPSLNWRFLKKLQVTHCDKLNVLSFAASMNSWAQRDGQQDLSDQEAHSLFKRDFPMLHGLSLVDKNIQMIQDGKLPRDIFGKLQTLTLACFHDKNAIFPPRFVLERLQNLQSLEVFCSSFEDIFQDEGLVDEGKHPMLENLRKLKFNKLYNLKRVWREDSLVSKILQSIETFEVWDCPCLTTIFPTVKSFQNLTELVVKNSSGLVHLVTASAVTNLVHLTAMTIIGCERMKEVVANDGDGEGKVISFGKLERFILQHLPSLEYFSSIPSCSFTFPSLWQIGVEECPKMKIFCKGTLSTPKLVEVFLFKYVWSYNRESDDLNTTIQKLSI